MGSPSFQFKQFTVWHDQYSMKVGTDGVLLGAWAGERETGRILDVGTGSGLIALMLAQRNTEAVIDAIDINESACQQARQNVERSPFTAHIRVFHSSFQKYVKDKYSERYDLIVSNPPYFVNALKSPDGERSQARHNDSLPLSDLLQGAVSLKTEEGRIALILPPPLFVELEQLLPRFSLSISRLMEVLPLPDALPKRYLVELTGEAVPEPEKKQLVIETARHQYTDDYIALTRDFYLKM